MQRKEVIRTDQLLQQQYHARLWNRLYNLGEDVDAGADFGLGLLISSCWSNKFKLIIDD